MHHQRDKEREADSEVHGPAPREAIDLCRDSFPAGRVCGPLATSLSNPASACHLSPSVTSSSNLIYQPCLLKLMSIYNSYVCSKRDAASIMLSTQRGHVHCEHISFVWSCLLNLHRFFFADQFPSFFVIGAKTYRQ